jgi:hypothetical protein
MEYTRILKQAWDITWKHKSLWLFGFILTLFGGAGFRGGSGAQYRFDSTNHLAPATVVGLIVAVIAVVAVVIVLALILSPLSRAALIGMVDEVEQTGTTSVRSGFRIGWSRLWRILVMDLMVGVPMAIVAALAILLALAPLLLLTLQRAAIGILAVITAVLLMLLVIGLLIVVGTVINIVLELAYRKCVLEKQGVFDSLRQGYHMARQNLRHVAVLWLVLLGIGLAVGFLMTALLVLVAGLVAAPALAVWAITQRVLAAIVVAVVLGIPGVVFLMGVSGIHVAFQSVVWTLVYHELASPALAEVPAPAQP